MDVQYCKKTISSLMDKYKLEYALVPKVSVEKIYMSEDEKYLIIYEDDKFVVFEYEKETK